MAQERIAFGGLTAVTILLALVVAGCGGGGSSSASGAASTGASLSVQQQKSTKEAESEGAAESSGAPGTGEGSPAEKAQTAEAKKSPKEGKAGSVEKKKHPPLELPTGKPEEGPTKAQQAKVPTADLAVTLPGGRLTADNSCDGKNLSPAISWGIVPNGTKELALFAMNVLPVEGKLYFDWAVAGIDPSLEGLEAGMLPKGAVVGQNGEGRNQYSLCPPGAEPENYIFALYAIPKELSPKPGFEPLALRKEATNLTQSVGLLSVLY